MIFAPEAVRLAQIIEKILQVFKQADDVEITNICYILDRLYLTQKDALLTKATSYLITPQGVMNIFILITLTKLQLIGVVNTENRISTLEKHIETDLDSTSELEWVDSQLAKLKGLNLRAKLLANVTKLPEIKHGIVDDSIILSKEAVAELKAKHVSGPYDGNLPPLTLEEILAL
jgi:hypothetical protein